MKEIEDLVDLLRQEQKLQGEEETAGLTAAWREVGRHYPVVINAEAAAAYGSLKPTHIGFAFHRRAFQEARSAVIARVARLAQINSAPGLGLQNSSTRSKEEIVEAMEVSLGYGGQPPDWRVPAMDEVEARLSKQLQDAARKFQRNECSAEAYWRVLRRLHAFLRFRKQSRQDVKGAD